MSTQKQSKSLNMPQGLRLEVDKDVGMVLEFMQLNIEARKLIKVAKAINELAGPLWGHVVDGPDLWNKFMPIVLRDS